MLDPELIPFLAKHMDREFSSIGVQSEDVDAATAMLALKHGPRILSPGHGMDIGKKT